MAGESGWLRIEVSEEAYNEFHSRFLSEKTNGSKPSKSGLAVKLISAGMKDAENMVASSAPIKKPAPGPKIVQIKKEDNVSFILKLDQFVSDKKFYGRPFAARYCLYKQLNLSVD